VDNQASAANSKWVTVDMINEEEDSLELVEERSLGGDGNAPFIVLYDKLSR
jgi:hypothetical protein